MATRSVSEWVDRLYACGRRVPDDVETAMRADVGSLMVIVADEERLAKERPAARFAQGHAARVLGELRPPEALTPMLRAYVGLSRHVGKGGVYGEPRAALADAIVAYGDDGVRAAVEALEVTRGTWEKANLASLLVDFHDAEPSGRERLLERALYIYSMLDDDEAREKLVARFSDCPSEVCVSDARFDVVTQFVDRHPASAGWLARLGDGQQQDQAFRFLETILARLPLFTIVDKATAHAVWDVKQVLEALHNLACPKFWDESGEYPELLPCAPCRTLERLDRPVFERLDKWNRDCVAVYGRSLVGSWWRSGNEDLVAAMAMALRRWRDGNARTLTRRRHKSPRCIEDVQRGSRNGPRHLPFTSCARDQCRSARRRA